VPLETKKKVFSTNKLLRLKRKPTDSSRSRNAAKWK
jgi:hypothetical protein